MLKPRRRNSLQGSVLTFERSFFVFFLFLLSGPIRDIHLGGCAGERVWAGWKLCSRVQFYSSVRMREREKRLI
jgi:hypothetical protein